MRRVIDGKVYDTETATELCDVSRRGWNRGDFQWDDTWLYRSPRGRFFIAGKGNALSRWSRPVGQNGQCGGEGIRTVDEEEARLLVEQHASDQYETIFGAAEEG